MNKAIVFIFTIFIFQSGIANSVSTFNHNCVISKRVIEKTETVTIFESVDDEGNSLFHIVAAIGTVFLPDIVDGICKRTIGDPDICNTVYDVTTTLVNLTGAKIYKGVTKGLSKSINWIANRGRKKSLAVVETRSYEVASGIKEVFTEYKKRCSQGSGIPWESIDHDYDYTNSEYSYSNSEAVLAIDNNTSQTIYFQLSPNGVNDWKKFELQKDYTGSYTFYLGDKLKRKNTAYIRIATDSKTKEYRLYLNRRYTIKWNSTDRIFDVYHY